MAGYGLTEHSRPLETDYSVCIKAASKEVRNFFRSLVWDPKKRKLASPHYVPGTHTSKAH